MDNYLSATSDSELDAVSAYSDSVSEYAICDVCTCYYQICTSVLLECSWCPNRIPTTHDSFDHKYDKNCRQYDEWGHFDKCFEICYSCKSIISLEHKDILIGASNEYDRREYFCIKCYENDKLCGYYKVDDDDIKRYHSRIIQEKDLRIKELEHRVKILEMMVEYMPDGPGYERAKSSFVKSQGLSGES